ncbi:MAG TPA: chemotaxis protein CheX [Acidimicrobiales bacterium]|nr:chemotaxis protein CheX [Acidimicrobiales bacterium]
MDISDDDIRDIVSNIFSSLLDLPVEATASAPERPIHSHAYTSSVQITGAWEGAVSVECSEPLARTMTEAMFGMEKGEAAKEEILDAVGEVANVAGGNVKALLPSPAVLSIPSVTEGVDYVVKMPGTTAVNHVGFSCDGEPLVVTVLRRAS